MLRLEVLAKSGTAPWRPATLPRARMSIASHHRPARPVRGRHVVDELGLPGVFVLMLLESACIPIPSEATMLFAGFNVAERRVLAGRGRPPSACSATSSARGSPTRSATSAASTCSRSTAASSTSSRQHLEWADRWFQRYGDATVFFTRMLPIIRTFISLPAGVARMPFWRFTVFTLARLHPVGVLLAFIGKQAGDNWENWKDSLHYVDYAVVAAIVIGVVWLIIRGRRRRSEAMVAKQP